MKTKAINFKKQILKTRINIPSIYTIHYFKYGKNFKYQTEKHNFYELVYIDSGSAIIVANENEIELKQNQAFLHKPNELHTIYTNNDFANSAIITFESKSKDITKLCDKILTFNNEHKTLLNKIINEAKISYNDPLDDLDLKKMTRKNSSPFGGDQIIKNCTELLLISLIRNLYNSSQKVQPLSDGLHSSIVSKIIEILDEKLKNQSQVTLEEISNRTNYSKTYIKSKFKEETGKSILQFFIDIKIEKAKKLLNHKDITINEVSDNLGFNSVQYFCRQFKLRTNMSPSTYANSIKTDNLL